MMDVGMESDQVRTERARGWVEWETSRLQTDQEAEQMNQGDIGRGIL